MWNEEERRKMHTGLWWRNLNEGDHLQDKGAEGKITLKWILKK